MGSDKHCCYNREGALRVKSKKCDLDIIVETFGGVAKGAYNNKSAEYITSYPVPVALSQSSGNVGYGNNMYLTPYRSKDGLVGSSGDPSLLDEMRTMVIGDTCDLFEHCPMPLYIVGSSEDDNEYQHTSIRINDDELCIDIKVETSSFLQGTVGATNQVTQVEKVFDLTKRKKGCKDFKCLKFCTFLLHTVYDVNVPAAHIYITFVKNSCGKFYIGLLHGAAAAAVDVPAGGIFPKPKCSGNYKAVTWEKYTIVPVPIKCKSAIRSDDLREKVLEAFYESVSVAQTTITPNIDIAIGGGGVRMVIFESSDTVVIDDTTTIAAQTAVENLTTANKIVSYNYASDALITAFVSAITAFNALLASLV